MISRIDLRGDALPEGSALRDLLPRADFDVAAALEKVRPICEDVHHRGDAALIDFAARFDGVEQTDVAVPQAAMQRALEELDPDVRAGLEESIRRLQVTCRAELEADVTTDLAPGARVTHPEWGAGVVTRDANPSPGSSGRWSGRVNALFTSSGGVGRTTPKPPTGCSTRAWGTTAGVGSSPGRCSCPTALPRPAAGPW